jgi:hypothetical protein
MDKITYTTLAWDYSLLKGKHHVALQMPGAARVESDFITSNYAENRLLKLAFF